MTNFGKWYHNAEYTPTNVMFDIGGTCRKAILNYTAEHKNPLDCGLSDSYSNGNGSLMRIHPFVLFSAAKGKDPFDMTLIYEASALTHGHERSKIGCGIYAIILRFLLTCADKNSIRNALEEAKALYENVEEAKHYHRLFDEDFEKLPHEEIRSSGYVVDTLEAAVWCVLTTDSYRDCVLKAVNLGEDTDTVAAIAGGLADALYGFDGIPKEWFHKLKQREWIEALCERAAGNWNIR
jgi:ADP-ribosylglycohydrolase